MPNVELTGVAYFVVGMECPNFDIDDKSANMLSRLLYQIRVPIPPAHCSHAGQISGYFWFAFLRLAISNTAKRVLHQGFQRLRVSALVITLTELRAMAAPATTGLR